MKLRAQKPPVLIVFNMGKAPGLVPPGWHQQKEQPAAQKFITVFGEETVPPEPQFLRQTCPIAEELARSGWCPAKRCGLQRHILTEGRTFGHETPGLLHTRLVLASWDLGFISEVWLPPLW